MVMGEADGHPASERMTHQQCRLGDADHIQERLHPLHEGAEIVMVPRPRPVEMVMKVIQKSRASIFPGVPTLYTAINNHPDVQAGKVDCIVVYKVDRLSRSLIDFARIIEVLEGHGATFVSVTQQFNTTHSMGRLTLNILLSFAQFEREIITERIRDKVAAAKTHAAAAVVD